MMGLYEWSANNRNKSDIKKRHNTIKLKRAPSADITLTGVSQLLKLER